MAMTPSRDRRTGFSRRRQYSAFIGYVLAVGGALVGAVLLAMSSFDPPAFAALRMAAASVTAPVSATGAALIDGVIGIPDSIADHWAVHAQNRRLRAEIARNRALVVRARTIAYDDRRLRALLQLRDRAAVPIVTARLVSSTASSGRRFAILNAGHWQGVRAGMPVLGPDGLIGRIVEAGPIVARVLLVTDAESIVPVRRTRDGLPAIVAGRGDGAVEVRSVNATDVGFRAGDVFVTSGTGGIYVPGTPVARVAAPGRDIVVARPIAQPNSLDFALVEGAFMPAPTPPPGSVTAP